MQRAAALVVDEGQPVVLGGMTLAERAVLLAHQAGLDPVYVRTLDPQASDRLRARGVAPLPQPSGSLPHAGPATDAALVVIGSNVLFEPALLGELLAASTEGNNTEPIVAAQGGRPLVIYVPPAMRSVVFTDGSLDEIAARLAAQHTARELPMADTFARRVAPADDVRAVERDYIRFMNGGEGESYFTKKVRRLSVPLTTRLVRLGARPTQVTLAGLGFAIAAAWFLSRGSYAAGLLGAVLYYTSTTLDCSDGEVARVTVREGRFGAWLETVVDYVTYFLILGAITMASQTRSDAGSYRLAAWVALAGTIIVIAVAGYLRHRVAAADPGQFDAVSAKALASSSRFHQFAQWSRQWIKRSSVTHVVVFLALINQLPVLLYLWAGAAVLAAAVFLVVEPFVARRVTVAPAGGHAHGI